MNKIFFPEVHVCLYLSPDITLLTDCSLGGTDCIRSDVWELLLSVVIKIIIVTRGAALRRASVIGTRSLPGMMESDPGFWLTMPRKGSISWRCGWRRQHDPELAVMAKQNAFLHARHSGAQHGGESGWH